MVVIQKGSTVNYTSYIPTPGVSRENEIVDISMLQNSSKVNLKLSQLAAAINKQDAAVVIVTGAGISVNSGIPVTHILLKVGFSLS